MDKEAREELAKYVYEQADKMTYSQIIEWLINEMCDCSVYMEQTQKQEQIIETQRRRIKKLLEKK